MENQTKQDSAASKLQDGTLLYVTDLVSDCDETLDFACQIAERQGIRMELVHVVDLAHEPSQPDAGMGIQYRLEALANRLRRLKGAAVLSILFGSPEVVISKRASEIKAKLIAFSAKGPLATMKQQTLVIRLKHTVSCPVLVLPKNAA